MPPYKLRAAQSSAVFLLASLCSMATHADEVASPQTDAVKGHAPTATTPVFVNKSAAGKNPAVDDQIEASYTFDDVDGDAEEPSNGVFQWKADASNIANATSKTFAPTDAQLKKFLTFEATPGTNPLITDPDRAETAVTSPPSGAPVLPSRAQLAAAFSNSTTKKSWGDAYMQCANQGQRLPSGAELQALFTTYTRANAVGEDSQGDITNTYGWAWNVYWSHSVYVSGTGYNGGYAYLVEDGRLAGNLVTNRYLFACIKTGTAELLPTITGASVPIAAVGTPVTAAYTYNGNATIPDTSRFQWYTATSATGAGKVLATGPGATTQTYTPVAVDGGKFLMVDITPASYDTVVGTTVSATGTQAVSSIQITALSIEKPTDSRASFQANYTVTGGIEADLTYQWYWRGEKLVGATNKTYAFPTLTIPSATTAEELKVEVAPRAQRSDIRTRTQAETAAPVSATLGLKSSIAWNAPFGQGTWYDMAKTCASQTNGNKRPGTTAELQALVTSLGNMAAYGVNTGNWYWTGTVGTTQGSHQSVGLHGVGMTTSHNDDVSAERGLCVAGTAPAVPALGGQLANGHTFSGTSFPTAGFTDAYFEFKGLKDSNAHDWTYRSMDGTKAIVYNDNNWQAGVTLKDRGSVNIEVYNVAGGNPTTYTINPSRWFFGYGPHTAHGISTVCSSRGASTATEAMVSGGSSSRGGSTLFGQWGNSYTTAYEWVSGGKRWNGSNGSISSATGTPSYNSTCYR